MLFRSRAQVRSVDCCEVRHNEEIVFYPSYVAPDSTGEQWTMHIQGCIYNLNLPWLRHPIMGAIRRALRIDAEFTETFASRLKPFLVGVEENRQIVVRVGQELVDAGKTSAAGLFNGAITLSKETLESITGEAVRPGLWVPCQAVLDPSDNRQFDGASIVVDRRGLSVISDVDDTVKHSNVSNRRDLFQNTFARVFSPVDGMAEIYRDLAARGAVFHYVSGSPWQLYRPLREFWETYQFPVGSFHLKRFRLRDSARKLKKSPQMQHKRTSIDPILAAFPDRKFVLIGDTGEQDPEIYASVLRDFPQQILGVYLRALHGETADWPRFQQGFSDLPADKWHLYPHHEELRSRVLESVEKYDGFRSQVVLPEPPPLSMPDT
ncbi:hypothetical protein Spb1_11360 [Planctopirus ephydatiae]|uniref:Phosphatidate phosphatase APP1 catalytic domain-containing protein n=1 Tax=Planctopirus ephydatiae TaxID=2528019 RepID=A0A518GL38_9PLAN|nr:hypothetical protein Spb1_11360 [Planctopirus ephydatiae]